MAAPGNFLSVSGSKVYVWKGKEDMFFSKIKKKKEKEGRKKITRRVLNSFYAEG